MGEAAWTAEAIGVVQAGVCADQDDEEWAGSTQTALSRCEEVSAHGL